MSDLFATSENLPFILPKENGYHSAWDEQWKGYRVKVPNGELFYASEFFDKKISDRTVEYFQENDRIDLRNANSRSIDADILEKVNFTNIQWKQDSINMYGKRIPLPRLTSWYGDSGKSYTYSGITSYPNEWNKGLLYLRDRIEHCAGVKFNSVLLNWYRNGDDYLNWHSDDEKELGRNPTIASANFGATRDFVIRRKDDPRTKISIPLKHGTLLIMSGELQHFWSHSVPKRAGVHESRFNLTFRRIGLP
jgi:alkylated DNA repair dioxygenase AlkB